MMISTRTLIPAAPSPWIVRPPISMLAEVAPPQMPLPKAKIPKAVIMGHRRPQISANWL